MAVFNNFLKTLKTNADETAQQMAQQNETFFITRVMKFNLASVSESTMISFVKKVKIDAPYRACI